MAKKIILFLADGFEEIEAVTPIDLLRRANIGVVTAGISSREIQGSHGIIIKADCVVDDLPGDADGVVIPGGMPGAANIAASSLAVDMIRSCREDGRLVAAICAAPAVVLEAAGLVAGLQVTAYPAFKDKFTDSRYLDQRVVVDRNVITSQGAGTAAEFALKIIEILSGKQEAERIHAATIQK